MIVEDGTGLTDSNSYVSVVFADDYFSARGVSEWSVLTTEQKEALLIKATDFIDNIYQWNGKRQFKTQALRFPRVEIRDYEGTEIKGIPTCLKQAVCDASLIANSGELFQTQEANGQVVSEKIGELAFTYANGKKETVTSATLYDSINTKLRGLFVDKSQSKIISGKVERV